MKLSKQEVLKIASLARLQLDEQEIEKYQKNLSAILDYVEQLQAVKTDGIEPTSQVTCLTNVKRTDKINNDYTQKQMLESAIDEEEKHLKVKNVF